jgi:hypothetical protein
LFEYLPSSPKIRPVLQRSLKIAPLLFFSCRRFNGSIDYDDQDD